MSECSVSDLKNKYGEGFVGFNIIKNMDEPMYKFEPVLYPNVPDYNLEDINMCYPYLTELIYLNKSLKCKDVDLSVLKIESPSLVGHKIVSEMDKDLNRPIYSMQNVYYPEKPQYALGIQGCQDLYRNLYMKNASSRKAAGGRMYKRGMANNDAEPDKKADDKKADDKKADDKKESKSLGVVIGISLSIIVILFLMWWVRSALKQNPTYQARVPNYSYANRG
jgi:hypothetical protein